MPNVLTVKVDFSDASDDQLLPSLLGEGASPGQPVTMLDDEGNLCEGVVERVDGRLTWLRPDWRTWVPGSAKVWRSPTVVRRVTMEASSTAGAGVLVPV